MLFFVASLCSWRIISTSMAPHLTTDCLKKLFEPAGSVFVAFLFLIIFQFVFKVDFVCACDPKENLQVCAIYMSLPAISLCIIVIITEKSSMRIFCSNGTGTTYKCIVFIMSVIKGLSVASLWIITLLIDGDWYACLKTTNYDLPPYEQIFCKKRKTPAEDAEIQVQKSLSCVSMLFINFGQKKRTLHGIKYFGSVLIVTSK